jgi:two-component system, OmpR family, response regulator
MPETGIPASAHRACPLLVVEDDADVRELVAAYLAANGFAVHAAGCGAEARDVLANTEIDAAVLDLNLPDEDGLDLVRLINAHYRTALIVVSARSSAVDRIVGLELGADDYLVKPFELRELLARVRRVLKRTRGGDAEPASPEADYRFGPFRLDPRARRLLDGEGRELALTCGEFDLLVALLERPQQVLSRNDLMQRTHGRKATPYDRVIDVQIGRLRRKLGAGGGEVVIRSIRNGGYLLALPVQRS